MVYKSKSGERSFYSFCRDGLVVRYSIKSSSMEKMDRFNAHFPVLHEFLLSSAQIALVSETF